MTMLQFLISVKWSLFAQVSCEDLAREKNVPVQIDYHNEQCFIFAQSSIGRKRDKMARFSISRWSTFVVLLVSIMAIGCLTLAVDPAPIPEGKMLIIVPPAASICQRSLPNALLYCRVSGYDLRSIERKL